VVSVLLRLENNRFITRTSSRWTTTDEFLKVSEVGDECFQVNGTSVNGMDHQSVVGLLKKAGTSVCLVVSREVVPVSDNEVHLAAFSLLSVSK